MKLFIHKVYEYALTNLEILLVVLLWLVSIFLVNPIGEFPLNDDWVYLQTLKHLYDYNEIFYTDWISSTLISQIIWGFLFCKLFGYSIFIARVSTLVSSLLIIVILYGFIKKLTGSKIFSFLITAAFIFNPVLYAQSFTFMTETSFNLLILLCVYAAYEYLNRIKINALIFCTIWGCIAVLIKQPGLIIAACLPFVVLTNNKFRKRDVIFTSASLLIVILCYWVFMSWINSKFSNPQHVNGVNQNLILSIREGSKNWFLLQRQNLLIIIMYVGFYLVPMLPILIISIIKWSNINRTRFKSLFLRWQPGCKKFELIFNSAITICALIIVWESWVYTRSIAIPCIENVLYNCGLGPMLLYDTFILKTNLAGFEIPLNIISWVSFISFCTGITVFVICILKFLSTIYNSIISSNSKSDILFQLLFYSGVAYAFLLVNVYMFDRYILVLVLLVLIMYTIMSRKIIQSISRYYYFLSFLLVGGALIFGVVGTHDYFAWNRAKWKALDILTVEHKQSPKSIDGGYEFNGIHNYSVNYKPISGKSWWWVYDNQFIVAMGMLPGYEQYLEVPYKSWLFNEKKSVYVLKRIDKD